MLSALVFVGPILGEMRSQKTGNMRQVPLVLNYSCDADQVPLTLSKFDSIIEPYYSIVLPVDAIADNRNF
jgi:hypothetical protein